MIDRLSYEDTISRVLWTISVTFFALSYLCSAMAQANARTTSFEQWPDGYSPQQVGKQIAEHFVTSPHQYGPTIYYSEIATWYGAHSFRMTTYCAGNSSRSSSQLMPGGSEATKVSQRQHVDDEVFEVVPLEIGLQAKNPHYIVEGKRFADRQWSNPQPDSLSGETRYWIDDMYMLTILQLEAYRATGNGVYLDRAAKEMAAYLAKLQQPSGLFFHAPMCLPTGVEAMAGSRREWPRCCAICPPSIPNGQSSSLDAAR